MAEDEKHKAAREKAETMRRAGVSPREAGKQLDKERRKEMIKPVPPKKK